MSTEANPTTPLPTGDYVLTNFRYLSAYNELVSRMSQRQQTLALFIAIFTGLVTALIATREIFKTDHSSIVWVMVGFPMASIMLTLLNYKYETLISLVREYLADLERVKDADGHYPSFNCDHKLIARSNRARYFHDLSCAALIAGCNTAAIGVYISICGKVVTPYSSVIGMIAVVGFGCVVAHLFLRRVYYTPKAHSRE